jgi:hypothetical protein
MAGLEGLISLPLPPAPRIILAAILHKFSRFCGPRGHIVFDLSVTITFWLNTVFWTRSVDT